MQEDQAESVAKGLAVLLSQFMEIANYMQEHIPPKDVLDMFIEVANGITTADRREQPRDHEYLFLIARGGMIARQLLIFMAGMQQGDTALAKKYDMEGIDGILIMGFDEGEQR